MAEVTIRTAAKKRTTKPSLDGEDCAWCGGTEGECPGGKTKELVDCLNCDGSGIELDYADEDSEKESYQLCSACNGTLKTPVETDCTGEKDCPGGCKGTERDPDEEDMSIGGPGPMMDCAVCGDSVHQSHGNFITGDGIDEDEDASDYDSNYDEGDFACDNHWEYGGKKSGPKGYRFTGKIAQDSGGGDGGGMSGGGDGGGMSSSGDTGAPSGDGGGDFAAQTESSPDESFGPDVDTAPGGPVDCPRCGDRCSSYSAANGTHWNCARCGWIGRSSYPRPRRKKRKDEEEEERVAKIAAGYETCDFCQGAGCESCKNSGLEIAIGNEPADTSSPIHQSVVDKLHPVRFSGMSPQMAAVVGHMVGKNYTDPQITELNVTSDGFVTGSRSGEEPGKLFLSHVDDLENNWTNLVSAAGLTNEEHDHARKLFRDKVRSNDWRRRGAVVGQTVPLEDPESAQEWGPCEKNDGKTSVVDFLGKKVCEEHLQYALADAPDALAKAMKGVETTKGPDRLNFMNAVQQIKKDVDRGQKTLEEVALKKDLNEQHGLALGWKQIKREDQHADEGVAVYRTVQAPDEDGARQKAIDHVTTHGFDSPVIKNIENSHKDFWNVFMRATPKPKVTTSNTQEKKAMYECDKCGVQATYESVTRTGRRLLCDEHATSSRIANDAAGIVNRVFPLHKESQSPPADITDYTDEELEWARKGCNDCLNGYCERHGTGTDELLEAEHYNGEHEDTRRGDCPVCQDAFDHDPRTSSLPAWIKESGLVKEAAAEKTAAITCNDCDGDGKCDLCGGRGCTACGESGLCGRCQGDGYETDLSDEYSREPRVAAVRCPGCGQGEISKTAQSVADPDEEPGKHDHGEPDGMDEFAEDLGAMPTSGGINPPEWQELLDKHPWAKIEQCPGCGQGQVTCTHEFHDEESRPSFNLPHSPKDVWDPQEAKFKGSEMNDFENEMGESGFVPQKDQEPSMTMEDLPTEGALKDLEGQGLKYHQTVRDPDEDSTHDHRIVHDDHETATRKHQEALDVGLHSELEPVMHHDTIHQQKMVHDVSPAGGGLGEMRPQKTPPKKKTSSCNGYCSIVARVLGDRELSDQIISYLYENDPEEWAKVAQTIGFPNCMGTGSTTDGKVCAACFGTGHGGGMMLKGGSVDVPEGADFGVLFGEDGQMYRTEDGSTFELVSAAEHDESEEALPPNCPMCHGETEFNGQGGIICHFCGYDDGAGIRQAAAEHDESEEEEDDDIKLFKFDHGPGKGNDMVHSEIHQQEHLAAKSHVFEVDWNTEDAEGSPPPSRFEISHEDMSNLRDEAADKDDLTDLILDHLSDSTGFLVNDFRKVSHGPDPKELAKHIESDQGTFKDLKKAVAPELKGDVQEMIDDDKELTDELKKSAAGEMSGSGCGRCGQTTHRSERCPTNKGSNMTTEGELQRYKSYEDFQPKEAAEAGVADKVLQDVLEDDPDVITDAPFDKDAALMEDPYELEDDRLMLDPFEAADKKKPVDQYAKEQGEAKQERTEKAEDLGDAGEVTAQVNPGSSSGTTIDDLVDNVGNGEHPVPVTFITDHLGEVAQGVEPATCRTCGQEMSAHAQWKPTTQAGDPRYASFDEEIGWMDIPVTDNRPRRGSFEKGAHQPTYDVSLHDAQAPAIGTPCQFCGTGGAPNLGAVQAFADPNDPVSGRIVAHQSHFDEYRASVPTAATPTPSVIPTGEGKGVTINIYSSNERANGPMKARRNELQ